MEPDSWTASLLLLVVLALLVQPAACWHDAKLQKMGQQQQQQLRGRGRPDIKCKALEQYATYCTKGCNQSPWNCGKDKREQVMDDFLSNRTVFSLTTNSTSLQYGCNGIVAAPLYYNISLKTSSVGVVIIFREEDELVVTVKMHCPYMIVPQQPNGTAAPQPPATGNRRLLAKAMASRQIGSTQAAAGSAAPAQPPAAAAASNTSSPEASPDYDPMAAIGLTWGWKAPYADPRTWQYQDFLAPDRFYSGFTYRINLIDVCGPGFIWSTRLDTCWMRFTRMQRQPKYEDFTLKKRHNVAVSIMVAPVQFKNGMPHATEEPLPATNHIQSGFQLGAQLATYKSFAIPGVDWPGYIALHDPVQPPASAKDPSAAVVMH